MMLIAPGMLYAQETLLERLETATTASLPHLLEELSHRLEAGEFFGYEPRIARLTQRFWQDPAAPPEVVDRLQHIYGMIAPALAAMEPALAETLFVHVPLTWATSGDARR
ncbi:MAG: hypothetical protein D6746_08065, partial [Bacteroidetes bacterium]